MPLPKLLAVGGAHIDRRGQVTEDFVPGASNPGVMAEDVGGGAFNALRNAVRRGADGALMSVRGGDAAGEAVAVAIAASGIADLSAIFLDRATPSYTALLDRDGDVIAALADMALYEMAFPKQLRRASIRAAIENADAVLCDANLPAAALVRLAGLAAGKPLFAIAISPAKAVRLREILDAISCLFMNAREAASIAGLPANAPGGETIERLRDLGLGGAVITQGGGPVIGFDGSGLFSIKPPRPRRIVDVTGAGDALAGTTLAAMMRGLPLKDALREGMAAAMLAVECAASVPTLAKSDFIQALSLVPPVEETRHGAKTGETHDA